MHIASKLATLGVIVAIDSVFLPVLLISVSMFCLLKVDKLIFLGNYYINIGDRIWENVHSSHIQFSSFKDS